MIDDGQLTEILIVRDVLRFGEFCDLQQLSEFVTYVIIVTTNCGIQVKPTQIQYFLCAILMTDASQA